MYLVFGFLLLAFIAWPISGVDTSVRPDTSEAQYCSSQNTGLSSSLNASIFQSLGACSGHCSDYAFGILQGSHCWCSNVAPAPKANTDVSNCDYQCPGYPKDPCGNPRMGLFAYIQMSLNMPISTASISSTMTTTTTSISSTVSAADTVTVTASISPSLSLVTELGATQSSAMTTSAGSHTASVQTVNGQRTTVTIGQPASTSTSAAASDAGASSSNGGSSKMTGGTIAGIVVGSIGGCAAVLAAIFVILVLRRRSRSNEPDLSFQHGLVDGDRDGDRGGKSPQMGLVRNMFADNNHSYSLSAGSSNARGQTFTDNRMKTGTMLYASGDHESSVSLQDNEDYSRPVLRLTNPD